MAESSGAGSGRLKKKGRGINAALRGKDARESHAGISEMEERPAVF